MAVRFVDGFDHYVTADGTAKGWTTFGGTIITTNPRNGPRNLQCGQDASCSFTNPAGSNATGIMGFGFKTGSGTTRNFANFEDSGTVQIALHQENDNTLTVRRNVGGTLLGQSTNVFAADIWYWLEVRVVINNATGSVEVRVNGTSTGWVNVSGQDTQQSANASFNVYRVEGMGGSVNTQFDDLYFGDGSTTFKGDSKVATVVASTGDGTSAQWVPNSGTDNGDRVSQLVPDGDTTFNASSVVNDRDSYNFAALGFTGTVHALQLNNWVKKSDAGARTINGYALVNSNNHDGASFAPSDANYLDARDIWETSPETAVAWTISEIDASEFGIRLLT